MKILSIRFCNLNSLEGEWEIDLQHPVFASGGIFAITGPTGSGKTTILDAVCLALYGQTPRLEKITTGSNEIMTRHTGECWAEVTFESSLGLFRCNWRQKRARNRPDGRLQQPEHEIVDALTDRVLENRIRDVAQKVRETTGMDYDQFTRSMLLAQGGFSAFLEAKPDERAPILEQITGTGIYSDISMKVHERYAMEREKYRSLMEKAESFLVMAPEAVHELQEELRRIEAEKMNLDAVIRILQERGESSARTEAAREELNRLETEYHQLLTHREEASERFHRYERGVKAAEYEQEWKGLQTLHEQVEGEKRELSHLQELDAKGRQELEAAGDALQQAEEKAGLCISQREATFQMLGRVRSLDTQIADVTAAITADEELKRAGCEKQSELASTRQLLTGRRDGYTAQRMEVEEYLRSHTGDERLIGEYSGIHTRIAVWEENLKRSEETAAALLTAEAEERAADEEFTIRQKRCDEQERKLEGIKSRIAILNDSLDKKKGRCPLSDLRRREGACHLRSEEIRRMGDILLELRREEALIRRLIGDIREAGQLMDRWDRERASLAQKREQQEHLTGILEQNLLLARRIRDLEEERGHLTPGEPCPLCGSRDHPFRTTAFVSPDPGESELREARAELSRIQAEISALDLKTGTTGTALEKNREALLAAEERLAHLEEGWQNKAAACGLEADRSDREEVIRAGQEAVEEEIRSLAGEIQAIESGEKELKAAQEELGSGSDELMRLITENREAEAFRTTVSERVRSLREDCARRRAGVRDEFSMIRNLFISLSLPEPVPERMREADEGIRERRDRLMESQRRLDELRESITSLEIQVADISAREERVRITDEEVTRRILEMQRKVELLRKERYTLAGERDPVIIEQEVRDVGAAAEKECDSARKTLETIREASHTRAGRMEGLTASLASLNEELGRLTPVFLSRIADAGFEENRDFLLSLLPPDEFARIGAEVDAWSRREQALSTLITDKRKNLAAEEEKLRSFDPLIWQDLTLDEATARRDVRMQTIGGIIQTLTENEEKEKMAERIRRDAEVQESRARVWERLHSLIGSADGKKFRVFAQGLTFQSLIAQANHHLMQMTDRYILLPDPTMALDLAVIDTWQADEVRSTRNLSGGESFIVSLALALGLSGMASRNVRVDSLFLDEGFGTLDDEALDTALDALSGLRQQGKLIGIISHVPAIRERIQAQIRVEKKAGGRSVIQAPGCRPVRR